LDENFEKENKMNFSSLTKNMVAASLTIFLLALNASAGANAMTTWTFRNGGFSVAMPGEPEYKSTSVDGGTTMHSWTFSRGDGQAYIVAYSDHSAIDLPAEVLGFVKGFEGQITRQGEFKIDGQPARWAYGASAKGKFYYYNTFSGNRLYQWVFVTALNTPIPADVQQFVDSFHLLP
jgi:hypothetical protein